MFNIDEEKAIKIFDFDNLKLCYLSRYGYADCDKSDKGFYSFTFVTKDVSEIYDILPETREIATAIQNEKSCPAGYNVIPNFVFKFNPLKHKLRFSIRFILYDETKGPIFEDFFILNEFHIAASNVFKERNIRPETDFKIYFTDLSNFWKSNLLRLAHFFFYQEFSQTIYEDLLKDNKAPVRKIRKYKNNLESYHRLTLDFFRNRESKYFIAPKNKFYLL